MDSNSIFAEITETIEHALSHNTNPVMLTLPHRLYVTDRQSLLFEAATSKNEDYKKNIDNPIASLLRDNAFDILKEIESRTQFIDLGPGYPSKSLLLIDYLVDQDVKLTYYPVDISPFFIKRANVAATQRGILTVPLLTKFEDLEPILDRKLAPAVKRVIFLGLTFNNFEIDEIVSILASITRADDICLVCHQPSDGLSADSLTRAYTGIPVRNFAFESLRIAGFVEADFHYEPEFRNGAVEMQFVSNKSIMWRGKNIEMGTRIVTARSFRLKNDEVWSAILKKMRIDGEYVDPKSGVRLLKLSGNE